MLTILAFLKKHWKKVLFVLLPVLTFIAGAAIHPQPARVVTVEKIVEKIVQVEVEKLVFLENTNEHKDTNTHVDKTKTTTPDGTVVEREISDTHAIETVVIEKIVTKEVEKKVFVDREIEKKVTIDNQKRFRISALVGVHPDILPVPKINSYAVGADLSVRVVGPVWAGVWGMGTTQGQAMGGISLGVEF